MEKNIWSVISGLAAVIAVALALFIFFYSETGKRKNLEITLISRTHLVNEEVGGRSGKIEVTYDGRKIRNYSLLQFRIENTGQQPIRKEDFSEPLAIHLKGVEEVLSAEKVSSDPQDLNVKSEISETVVSVKRLLLNPTDWYVLELATVPGAGLKPEVDRISARVSGIKEIKYHSSLKASSRDWKANLLPMFSGISSLIVVFIFLFQRFYMNRIYQRELTRKSMEMMDIRAEILHKTHRPKKNSD